MHQFTHAWLALKAVELLNEYKGKFNKTRNNRLKNFLGFICQYPDTFVRGAWFPDSIIGDNIHAGHTWKYYLDPAKGKKVKYRPPSHINCYSFVEDELDQKVSLYTRYSDLPDRCEALGQSIRDMNLITNKIKSGDVVVFNNSQIALFFLMLAHYVCDAHVPVHCDRRDLNDPSKVHWDLEDFWEVEIDNHFKISKKDQFDLDENGLLQRKTTMKQYKKSVLYKCEQVLKNSKWSNLKNKEGWQVFLGEGNNNFWDYLVSICLVSFHMSRLMFPDPAPPGVNYDTVKIMDKKPFKKDVIKYSPYILADAINSVALLWLATWERWELLEKIAPKN